LLNPTSNKLRRDENGAEVSMWSAVVE